MTSKAKDKLVFDTSALIWIVSILQKVKSRYNICVPPSVFIELPLNLRSEVEKIELTDDDREMVVKKYKVYKHNKEKAIEYLKHKRHIKDIGEIECIVLAKKKNLPCVFHERQAKKWGKLEKITVIDVLDLPDMLGERISEDEKIAFYEKLDKQRYEGAYDRLEKIKYIKGKIGRIKRFNK